MLIKDLNLYINEKNVTTIMPIVTEKSYGLAINGVNYKFGEYFGADKELQKAKLGKMKALQTQIIKKIEGK